MNAPKPLPKHVASGLTTRHYLLSGVCALLGLSMFALGSPAGGIIAAAVAVFLGWWARRFSGQLEAVQALNSAVREVQRGDLDQAAALVARAPKHGRWATVPRGIELVSAIIAMRRNRFEDVVVHTTKAATLPLGIWMRPFQEAQRAQALSMRALAEVALGRLEAGAADAKTAEAARQATPDVLARARLVQALVLSRAGEDDALAANLKTNATLYAESAATTERGVVRALRKMSQAKRSKSVYREPSPPVEKHAEAVHGLLAAVAPEAVAYVDRGVSGEAEPAANSVFTPTTNAKEVPKTGTHRAARRVVFLWLLLIMLFLSIWQFLGANGERAPISAPVESSSSLFFLALFALFFVVFGIVVVARRSLSARLVTKLADARRENAIGDKATARAAFEALTKLRYPAIVANGELELARLDMAEGRFERALTRCQKAIGAINAPMIRNQVSDILLPSLVGELAVAEASLARAADAEGHLATLARDFAAFPGIPSAVFRVRTTSLVRAGRVEEAARMAADRHPELALPRRDELLADLLVATLGAGKEERERLGAELFEEPSLRTWIDRLAPGLCDRALAAPAPVRIADAVDDAELDEAARETREAR